MPTRAKRLLTGGRAVTIDGNTLDPTLQLALAGMRAFGMNGLVRDEDAAASRAQLREMTLGFGGPQIHVGVRERIDSRTCRTDRSPSLPPGDIAAGAAAGLLPRRRLGDR